MNLFTEITEIIEITMNQNILREILLNNLKESFDINDYDYEKEPKQAWAELCFGSNVNHDHYRECYELFVKGENKWFINPISSRNNKKKIKQELVKILTKSRDGFLYRFKYAQINSMDDTKLDQLRTLIIEVTLYTSLYFCHSLVIGRPVDGKPLTLASKRMKFPWFFGKTHKEFLKEISDKIEFDKIYQKHLENQIDKII